MLGSIGSRAARRGGPKRVLSGQLATNEANWSGTSPVFGELVIWAGYYQEIIRPDFSATTVEGIVSYLQLDPAAAVSIGMFGVDTEIFIKSGNTQTFTTLTGIFNVVQHSGSGNVNTIIGEDVQVTLDGGAAVSGGNGLTGLQFTVAMTSAGAVNLARGIVGDVRHNTAGVCANSSGAVLAVSNNHATGSITLAVGCDVLIESSSTGGINTAYFVRTGVAGGTGPITTAYGLYVSAIARAGVTTAWGVYVVSDNSFFGGNVQLAQQVTLTGDVTPAQITADQNDYNPTGLSTASVLRLSSDATRTITGLAGGADGRIIVLLNIGAQEIFIEHESVLSTAANRFALSGASGHYLSDGSGAVLVYDSTSSRWRMASIITTRPRIVTFASATHAHLANASGGTLDVAAIASGTFAIARGGTNSATALNNNRIMVSSAGAIVEAAALTNGQLLIGSTAAAPVAAALTAGTGITITNGAGSITVAASSAVVRVLDRDVTEATVSNTVTETTVYSFTVPGGTLGSDRALHFMPMLTLTNNTGVTRTITIRIKYGATTVFEGVLSATTSASVRAIMPISPGCVISAANATNAQRSMCGFTLAAAATVGGVADTNDQNEFAIHNAIAEDSTLDKTLAITVQHSVADVNMSATFLPMQTLLM